MSEQDVDAVVRDNLARVRERIGVACHSAGRSPDEVTLIGVSKYVGAAETLALVRAGCEQLGEARPQQLWEKVESEDLAAADPKWRLIGHLQRNKAKRTVEVGLHSIDSVDSLRLARAVDEAAAHAGVVQAVLLEVNVSGDAEKHGFAPGEMSDALAVVTECENLRVEGLMGMAARGSDNTSARRDFAALRELRSRLATSQLPLAELSIGMSGDLEAAIAEGSTMVRVGSALWEGLR